MNIRIEPRSLRGEIPAPASKSDAHRLLIAAALADRPTDVLLEGSSRDIEVTAQCLQALGARIDPTPGGLRVSPIKPAAQAALDCGESGSTLRFMLPLAAALGIPASFTGGGRLPERPLAPLDAQLAAHGAKMSSPRLPFSLSGALTPGQYTLPGDISSQYITGLLLPLPRVGKSVLRLTTPLASAEYVDMTLHTLARFGVEVQPLADGYRIPCARRYRSPGEVHVAGDWSGGAFFLAAGAIGGDVTCTGLDSASPQADRRMVSILRGMGAAAQEHGGVRVRRSALAPCQVSVDACPDLLPILAVTAAFAPGVSHLTGAARLRLKESDRLSAMAQVLTALGAACRELPDGLAITGGGPLRPAEVDGYNDHRIVMAAAIAMTCGAGGVIRGAQAVEKSYPDFFDRLNALGGAAYVI
ncbi:MAG: 3-phosphoshikimate 1-carboxyvinyltransferase [Eubacteriales bacterium]|nr:3-phosphoshikimate 1-carboxyvinyltransferase [Eubacteriales bacterium]